MRKFKLYVMTSGERGKKPIIANGFVEAEQKAKELYEQVYPDYPCDDTYIECVEDEFDLNFDHLIMQKDCFGDIYWRKIICKGWMPLYVDLLSELDQYEIDEWRNEEERHISDLSEDELKTLRGQVSIGSMYTSDYNNSFFIDEDEVMDVCEHYDDWLEEEQCDDTPENFAHYVEYCY
jgi:hypothetical protein